MGSPVCIYVSHAGCTPEVEAAVGKRGYTFPFPDPFLIPIGTIAHGLAGSCAWQRRCRVRLSLRERSAVCRVGAADAYMCVAVPVEDISMRRHHIYHLLIGASYQHSDDLLPPTDARL